MPTHRVTLIVEWPDVDTLDLPLDPVRSRHRDDGRRELSFDVEGESFDVAAGRLWGETAACGLHVVAVEPQGRALV
jgi:hypothetical protein